MRNFADIDETVTDAAIFAASQADPAQFATIFDRHYDAVFGFLARRYGPSVAEELASETFTRAYEHRERFDGERFDDARPWLFGIAMQLAYRHRRSEARKWKAYARVGLDPLANENALAILPDEVHRRLDATADGGRLAAAIASLSDGERDALLLLAWGGLSYPEIAEALDVPVGTVRSRLNRARAALVKQLGAAESRDRLQLLAAAAVRKETA